MIVSYFIRYLVGVVVNGNQQVVVVKLVANNNDFLNF